MINRRHFLTTAGAVSAGMALGASAQLMAAPPQEKPAGGRSAKRLLILGGTGFIAPESVSGSGRYPYPRKS